MRKDSDDVSGPPDSRPRQEGPARGRPRSETVERAIVEAVVALLEEGVPLAELSIERIARTAGVGKATIYRRWSGKEALFVDVVRAAEPPGPALPGTSMRDDLVALVEQVRQRGLMTRSSALLHNVYAQMKSSPKIWTAYHSTVVEPRRRLQLDILRRGQENGELRDDIDVELMNDMVAGPMLLRTVLRPDADLPEGLSEQIVDAVLDGLRPATGSQPVGPGSVGPRPASSRSVSSRTAGSRPVSSPDSGSPAVGSPSA